LRPATRASFTPKKGIDAITVDTLHYPGEAKAAYEIFCKLRNDGVIPQGTRQQGLPFLEDTCRLFTANARDMDVLVAAYVDAMRRDVARICSAIPHDDLVLQWDINWEVIAVEYNDYVEARSLWHTRRTATRSSGTRTTLRNCRGHPSKCEAGSTSVLWRFAPPVVSVNWWKIVGCHLGRIDQLIFSDPMQPSHAA
jgi:hypothetical protein